MILRCGTKIEWRDSYSLSLKKGIIVEECHTYAGRTPDDKYGIRIDYYIVTESDTGLIYNVSEKDITCVKVDGEWVDYKLCKLSNLYQRRSGRYPWEEDKVIRNYIDNDVKVTNELCVKRSMDPKQVIFNGPATIVLWKDGTKTIVKRREGEPDDKEKAVMYCILKKACGNKATMDKYLKLFIKEESNDEEKKD